MLKQWVQERFSACCRNGAVHLCLSVLLLANVLAAPHSDRSITVETFRTHSRLTFKVDSSIQTEWKEVRGGFELLLKTVRLTDLGAPFGYEKEWGRQFTDVQDQRLASVIVEENKAGVKISGRWRFPAGDQAPADPSMELFQFKKDSPQALVVDFWEKKGPTVAEVKRLNTQKRQIANVKRIENDAKSRAERRQKTDAQITQAGDLTIFCKGPSDPKKDVYLHFMALHEPFPFEKWFPTTNPDADFPYIEPKSNEKDAEYVRLALDLYRKGKSALVIRTLDFLDSEFPKSPYRSEMRFLRANALIKLGMESEAAKIFKILTIDAKGSPEALVSGMYLAGKSLSRGENLAALEAFLWLLQNYKDHALTWVFNFGVAEASFALGQTERAAEKYEAVVQTAPDRELQAEAALRKGDAFMDRKLYDQAIAAYFKGSVFYKDEADKFGSVYLNRAEALYWLDQHSRSEVAFKTFLEKFPGHPSGWRASYRIGEIFSQRKGAENEAYSREWFYKTINQYPFSPGALLARMKLVQCGDHGGMDYTSAMRLFDTDASKFDGSEQVKTDGFSDFYNLAKIRTLVSMGRQEESVREGALALRKTLKPSTRKILGSMYSRALRKRTMDLLEDGKDYEALAFYNLYSPSIPKEAEPLVPDFLLKLADAAVALKLGTMAQKVMDHYRKAMPEFEKQFDDHPLRSIAQRKEDPDQKIQQSKEALIEAKALWIRLGSDAEQAIQEKMSSVTEESPLAYQKEVLLGAMADKKGDLKGALTHAMKAQTLVSGKDPMSVARVGQWLSKIFVKQKNNKSAIQVLTEVQTRLDGAGVVDSALDPDLAALPIPEVEDPDQIRFTLAELLEKEGRFGEAAQIYFKMMERGQETTRIFFSYASALRQKGTRSDVAKAREFFQRAATSEKEDFWQKMAKEALENERAGKWKPGLQDRQGG